MVIRDKKKSKQRGAALLMVLLVTGLLSGIVFIVLTVLNDYAELESKDIHELDTLILAEKGISFGCHPLIFKDDPLLTYESEDKVEKYMVTISNEASRLDINRVLETKDKEFLRTLFTGWGMNFDRASELVDALVDWVDKDENEELNGAERSYYLEQGFSNMPYNVRFKKIKDLKLVRGFTEVSELKPDWEDYFTIWSGEKIDIHESKVDVLAAATSLDRSTIEQFQVQISGADGMLGTKDDKKFNNLDEAFSLLGLSGNQEVRKKLFSRVQLASKSRRVQCLSEVSETKKEVMVVIRYIGERLKVIHKKERTIFQ